MRHVAAFGRSAEAQAQGREGANGDLAIGGRGQVVTFVEDKEPEAAQFAWVEGGGVIGDDSDWQQLFFAAAEDANLIGIDGEGSSQGRAPLLQQVECRDDDDCPPALPSASQRVSASSWYGRASRLNVVLKGSAGRSSKATLKGVPCCRSACLISLKKMGCVRKNWRFLSRPM